MKNLRIPILFALASLLMAADCNTDAEYYSDVYAVIPNIINVETQPSFAVGDYLEINTDGFSRYEDELNGQSLDIYRSSGFAPSVSFTYVVEKLAGDFWLPVDFSASVQQIQGITSANEEFILARSVYNSQGEQYEYKARLPLMQTGSYRLRFNYSSQTVGIAQMRTDSDQKQLYVNITSTVPALNGGAFYNFTVN